VPINFSNTNSVWASVLVETLQRLGLTIAVICPGSRSAPLAVAFAQNLAISAIPVLDERSAAFFALGLAKQSGLPIALVCTSGTAGANFYPAVIEATESRVPLLVLTADRPPELRHCNAGQTIDQQKLFGTFPHWYAELAIPSVEEAMLAYLRQTCVHAWERTLLPVPGVVHLNLPFRDPLPPLADPTVQAQAATFDLERFFAAIEPLSAAAPPIPVSIDSCFEAWRSTDRVLIIAGLSQPQAPAAYCQAVAQLSQVLGFPVLAEGLSPLRNYADLNSNLVSTYDAVLRNPLLAEQLAPKVVIRLGEMPTSKELRLWLEATQPRQWVIEASHHNLDSFHGHTTHLRTAIGPLVEHLGLVQTSSQQTPYLSQWQAIETRVRDRIDQTMNDLHSLFEGKAAWLLSQHLPPGTPLFIASSMSVRDVEWFWKPGNLAVRPYFNRGANGIDGTLSTAIGIAHGNQPSVLLTGDLALLHDTNGFLLRQKFKGHLTIVLINNNGGGIFEMLPIAQFEPPFEEFFATPQHINFAQLCATYGVDHEPIASWQHFIQRLNPLPQSGIRVLELQTDRKADAKWRKTHLPTFACD